jgi:hypothetical protein
VQAEGHTNPVLELDSPTQCLEGPNSPQAWMNRDLAAEESLGLRGGDRDLDALTSQEQGALDQVSVLTASKYDPGIALDVENLVIDIALDLSSVFVADAARLQPSPDYGTIDSEAISPGLEDQFTGVSSQIPLL